jgi:hypothetical protein
MIRPTLAILAALALGACSLGALDDFSGGASVSDAGADVADVPSGDAKTSTNTNTSPDAAPNDGLLYSDGFESNELCTPWTASRATASTAQTSAKSGTKVCGVCTVGTTGGGIERDLRPTPPATTLPAGSYTFTVWVRSAAYTGSIAFEIYELTAAGTRGTYRKTVTSSLSSAWQALQIVLPINAPVPGFHVELWLDASPPDNTCFFADEASLVRTP